MIAYSIIWVYMFFLCLIIGVGIVALFERLKIFEVKLNNDIPADHLILIGFIGITAFLGFFSLLFRIEIEANLILLLLSMLILVLKYSVIKEIIFSNIHSIRLNYTIWAIGISTILVASVLYTVVDINAFDTGLYHAQAIQWIENFKVVPGLGNLHSRLAFNSHFFLPSALFDLRVVNTLLAEDGFFYPVNGFLYLLLTIRLILNIGKSIRENQLFDLVFNASLLYFSYTLFAYRIQSPTPDIAVGIFIIYIFLLYLGKNVDRGVPLLLIVLITLTLPIFKLCTIFLGLFPLTILVSHSKRNIWGYVLLGVFIVLPFIIRNVILSGYFIYPFASIDVFNVDWKLPIESVHKMTHIIKNWARVPFTPYQDVMDMSFLTWFKIWIKQKGEILIYLNLALPIILTIYFIRNRNFKRKHIIASLILLINLVFWFFMAPDPRFAHGLLVVGGALVFALPFIGYSNTIIQTMFSVLFVLICFQTTKDRVVINVPLFLNNLIIPAQLPEAETQLHSNNNISYRSALKLQKCNNSEIPCAPFVNNNLRLRGATIESGFRLIRTFDSELKRIQKLQTYIDHLKDKDVYVLIAVKDEASRKLANQLRPLGSTINWNEKLRWSYIGVFNPKKRVVKEVLDSVNVTYSETISEQITFDIQLESAGHGTGNTAKIFINNKNELKNTKRGLNIVVYDYLKNRVIDVAHFDTYGHHNPEKGKLYL